MKNLSKKEWIAVSVSLVFIVYMFMGDVLSNVFGELNGNSMENNTQGASANNEPSNNTAPALSVQVQDIKVGTGPAIQKGMQVAVNYVLKLTNGTVIQDSKQVNAGKPFIFTAGAGQLIPGWEMGILGMHVGGKRMITIPPSLGYGSQQVGNIPPNSTLVFEIEVVSASLPAQ